MTSKRLWIIAFLAAFCLHVTILAGSAYFPELFKPNKRAEIYNVKLVGYEPSPKRQQRPGPSPTKKEPAREQVRKAPETKVEKRKVEEKKKAPVKQVKRERKVEKKPPKKTVNKPKPRPRPKVKKAVKKAVSTSPKRKRAKEKRAETPPKRQQKRPEPSSDELIAKRIKGIEEKIKARQEEELLAKRIAALEAKKKGAGEPKDEGGPPLQTSGTSTRYGALAKASIMTHFVVPPILRDKELKAVVSIFVTNDGRIARSVMRKGSGSEIFDHCVMRAIKETGSLPPLPPELRPGPLEIEITFRSSDQI